MNCGLDVVFERVVRCRVNSVVAVEENKVAKDTPGEDQNQTSSEQNERSLFYGLAFLRMRSTYPS